MRTCPYCGRVAQGNELRCVECTTDLPEGDGRPLDVPPKPAMHWVPPDRVEDAQAQLLRDRRLKGRIVLGMGVAILLCTFIGAFNSPSGGWVVFPTGMIALGLFLLRRPAYISEDGKKSLTLNDIMRTAANLEGTHRAEAIRLYEEVARRFPGTPQSEEAQRNVEVLRRPPDRPRE